MTELMDRQGRVRHNVPAMSAGLVLTLFGGVVRCLMTESQQSWRRD